MLVGTVSCPWEWRRCWRALVVGKVKVVSYIFGRSIWPKQVDHCRLRDFSVRVTADVTRYVQRAEIVVLLVIPNPQVSFSLRLQR
jgi:hypothetical protein